MAHPDVTVELGSDRYRSTAEVLDGEERDRVYAAHAVAYPTFADYQTGTDRVIPVVHLIRS